jgi:hypothetical protein
VCTLLLLCRYREDPTTFEWYRSYTSLQPVLTRCLWQQDRRKQQRQRQIRSAVRHSTQQAQQLHDQRCMQSSGVSACCSARVLHLLTSTAAYACGAAIHVSSILAMRILAVGLGNQQVSAMLPPQHRELADLARCAVNWQDDSSTAANTVPSELAHVNLTCHCLR